MTIELALIIGFLFHLIGDYLFQNNWMAQNKVKSNLPALIHALTYSIPFLWLLGYSYLWLIVFLTHFVIDRFRLAKYWIMLMNNSWGEVNNGFGKDMPSFLSVWLMIIIDNTFHLIINSICIGLHFV